MQIDNKIDKTPWWDKGDRKPLKKDKKKKKKEEDDEL